MKYSETPKSSKKAINRGLYVIIGLCLLIIGGAAWFSVSSGDRVENQTSPKTNSEKGEYSAPNQSYTDNTDQSMLEPPIISSDTTPTADSVSSEPYSSESETKEEETNNSTQATVFMMPVQGKIIKKYSDKELQFSSTYGDMRIHKGIDIESKIGTAISACSDGVIESIEVNTNLGAIVTIDHKNGITVKYAGIENLKFDEGDTVKAGDIIGTVGTVPAECMDKEHLHLEVFKNGESVEPMETLGLK